MPSKRDKEPITRKLEVYDRMKDGKPMKFAVLPHDPTAEEYQQFADFLNSERRLSETESAE